MNRKERRRMSKRLGIMQYQNKLTRQQKFNLIRENIITGKKMHQENVEKNITLQEELEDQEKYDKIYKKAVQIAKETNMPLIDAFDVAEKQIESEK